MKSLRIVLAVEVVAIVILSLALAILLLFPAGRQETPASIEASPATAPPTLIVSPAASLTPAPSAPSAGAVRLEPVISTAQPATAPSPIATPALLVHGPLTYSEQLWLYNVSLRYRAPSPQEAQELARALDFAGADSHASNMCGPLALALLRDANLVVPETDISRFWLLDPTESGDRDLLSKTFPAEQYEHYKFTKSLKYFDWQTFPMEAGDFLYIYAGVGGNFEHALVVTRVDAEGRAFSVTNLFTPDGFVVEEILLYDPADARAGIFVTWTQKQYTRLGATGFGGFELWRRRAP